MHLGVKMCVSATGNAMSVPCELVAHHPNRRPLLLHSSLCTLTTDYLQSKWYRVGVGGASVPCFSGLGGADCGAGVFGADSFGACESSCDPEPWPLDPAASWKRSPERW